MIQTCLFFSPNILQATILEQEKLALQKKLIQERDKIKALTKEVADKDQLKVFILHILNQSNSVSLSFME